MCKQWIFSRYIVYNMFQLINWVTDIKELSNNIEICWKLMYMISGMEVNLLISYPDLKSIGTESAITKRPIF